MLTLKSICDILSSLREEVNDAVYGVRRHTGGGLFGESSYEDGMDEDCLSLAEVDSRLQDARHELEELPEDEYFGEDWCEAWGMYREMDSDIRDTYMYYC